MKRRYYFVRVGALLVLTLALYARPLIAQPILEATILAPSSGFGNDYFGISTAIDGERVLIGSDDKAFIIERGSGTWEEMNEITPGDGELFDLFGYDVDLKGTRALIGAPGDDDDAMESGAAYIFELQNGSWREVAKLKSDDPDEFDSFGRAVSLNGERAIIGAFIDSEKASAAGAAYIFEVIDGTWTQVAKLTASDAEEESYFGESVSIHGNRAIVGAPYQRDGEDFPGAAYLFELQNGAWTEVAKLTSNSGFDEELFGHSVSLHGDRALVGTPWHEQNEVDVGAAYVFELSGGIWKQTAQLLASDPEWEDAFGYAVSLHESRAIIATIGYDGENGKVYIFELVNDSWVEVLKLTPPVEGGGDGEYGESVDLQGDRAIFGAWWYDDDSGGSNGAVFLYDLNRIEGTPIELIDEFPADYTLMNNYPNPFNEGTLIQFELPDATHVRLSVYDILGKKVVTLVDELRMPGPHRIRFLAGDLPSGQYLFRLETPERVFTRQMMLIK